MRGGALEVSGGIALEALRRSTISLDFGHVFDSAISILSAA
jgi:hypothetical protein